jgi:hypothetical protein
MMFISQQRANAACDQSVGRTSFRPLADNIGGGTETIPLLAAANRPAALLTQTVAVVVIIIGVATAAVAPQAVIAATSANYDAAVNINVSPPGCDAVVAVSVATEMTAAGCDVAAAMAAKVAAAVPAMAAAASHCAG